MHDFLPGFKWLREVFEMKKKISLIIAAAMVLGLSACGSGNGSVSTEQNTEVTTAADTATGDAVEKDVAESDLKGEGPYTLEDTFADGGGAGGGRDSRNSGGGAGAEAVCAEAKHRQDANGPTGCDPGRGISTLDCYREMMHVAR